MASSTLSREHWKRGQMPSMTDLYEIGSDWGVILLCFLAGVAAVRFAAFYFASHDWGALFMMLLSASVFLQFWRVALAYAFDAQGLGYGSAACFFTTWLLVGLFAYIVLLQIRGEWTKHTRSRGKK
jgi:hypothetical protein